MDKNSSILITGGTGLLGTALAEQLKNQGFKNISSLSSKDCDLTNLDQTNAMFAKLKPDYVFHCAGYVHGIMGNLKNQAKSILMNTLINTNVVHAAYSNGIKKFIAVSTGAIYPYPTVSIPLKESELWQGEPHYAEAGYAHAKRHMLAFLDAYKQSYGGDFAYVISCNLFGPNDRFDIENGHVIPSLIRKFYEALVANKEVVVWGNGSAKRDFLYVEDAASALIHIAHHLDGPVNIGSGRVNSIKDVVDSLFEITGKKLKIIWDESKPNGQDARYYDLSALNKTGFTAKLSLHEGIEKTFKWYQKNHEVARKS